MEVFKMKESPCKGSSFIKALKSGGMEIKSLGKRMKWVNCYGGRIGASFEIWQCKGRDVVSAFLVDGCGMLRTRLENVSDVLGWLKDHGYVTEKEFYLANGMTEETWNEWNGGSDDEG